MKIKKELQEVIINKETSVYSYTPEEELKYLIERGDWELVIASPAFLKRSPEGQAQTIKESIDVRINQLGETLYLLVNRGPDERAAAMGVLQRKRELEAIRDEMLKSVYEQFPTRALDTEKVKVDF